MGSIPAGGDMRSTVVALCRGVPSPGTTSISWAMQGQDGTQPGGLCPGTGTARHPSMAGTARCRSLAQLWGGMGMLRGKPGSGETSAPRRQPSLTHPELPAKPLPGPSAQPTVTPAPGEKPQKQQSP